MTVAGMHGNHAYQTVFRAIKTHTAYTGRYTSHLAHGCFREVDGSTATVGEQNIRGSIGKFHTDHLIALQYLNGFFTLNVHAGVFGKRSFFDYTLACGEHEEMRSGEFRIVKVLAADKRIH